MEHIKGYECPLCKGKDFARSRFGIIECSRCGLKVSPEIRKENVSEELVDNWFDNNYGPEPSFWVRIFEARNNKRYYKDVLPFTMDLQGGRLLEIGAGSGSFLNYMRMKKFNVKGCDQSAAICNYVEQHLGIKMYNCPVREIPDSDSFDMVILKHVLEHLADPVMFLREIKEKIKSGGLLYVAVPNVASWNARASGWTSFEPYHLVYFDRDTLGQTLKKAGFEIVTTKTFEPFSGWFLTALRSALKIPQKSASQRYSQQQIRKRSWIEHAYCLSMITAGTVTLPLRYIQGNLGRGEELIMIARTIK